MVEMFQQQNILVYNDFKFFRSNEVVTISQWTYQNLDYNI